jgi:hypothetical protein
MTLPKQQQLRMVKRLQQLNQQEEDLTSSTESMLKKQITLTSPQTLV